MGEKRTSSLDFSTVASIEMGVGGPGGGTALGSSGSWGRGSATPSTGGGLPALYTTPPAGYPGPWGFAPPPQYTGMPGIAPPQLPLPDNALLEDIQQKLQKYQEQVLCTPRDCTWIAAVYMRVLCVPL